MPYNNSLCFMALVGGVFMLKSCTDGVEICGQPMWPYMQFLKLPCPFQTSECQILFKYVDWKEIFKQIMYFAGTFQAKISNERLRQSFSSFPT